MVVSARSGLGFHAKEGWWFKRIEAGAVLITLEGDEIGAQIAVDDNTWASIAASVSAGGETASSWKEAHNFHNSDRTVEPASGSVEDWLLAHGPKPLREGGASALLAKAREWDAALTAKDEQIQQLTAALEKYGRHVADEIRHLPYGEHSCGAASNPRVWPCTCGLSSVLTPHTKETATVD